jgi:tetratricopeptide (TPR) repeat protein
LALLEALAASGQAGNTYEATLAECRLSLATLYYRTGRLAQAEELYGKGLRTAEAIVHEKPDAAKDALTLAMIYSSLGKVTHARAETAAAVGWFDKAIGLLSGWVEKAPENVAFRSQLRDARAGRVRALSRLGRHADALTECEQALTIDTPQTRDALRALRALTLGRQGAWARAQAEAEELVQAKDLSGGTLYELAGAYSLAAAAVTQDKDLLPADRTERAGRYATRAVELLVRAREAGYFNSAANVEGMRKDSDLGVLRPRADYQQLLNELMKKPQPGAK